MDVLLALLAGLLTAAAVWLLLDRSLVRVLFGLALLGNAANLVIFSAGRLTAGAPPIVPVGAEAPLETVANALPQALILTAIVISFGLFAFALALVHRAHKDLGTADIDALHDAEPSPHAGSNHVTPETGR